MEATGKETAGDKVYKWPGAKVRDEDIIEDELNGNVEEMPARQAL